MLPNFDGYVPTHIGILDHSALQELHSATLDVLRRTGVRFLDAQALERLKRAGCWVDGDKVRFPIPLVEWAVRTAPHLVVIANRDGKPAMYLEPGRPYFGLGGGAPNIIELDGERRRSSMRDVEQFSRLADALPNIDFVESMAVPAEKPADLSDLYAFYGMVANTKKPLLWEAYDFASVPPIVSMCEAVSGGAAAFQRNPFAILVIGGSSPLQHDAPQLQAATYCAERALPFVFATPGTLGVQAPATLAGALIEENAEILSALVLTQLVREGSPFIRYSGLPSIDMSRLTISYAGPEFCLSMVAGNELARYYGLPVFTFGGSSDSKCFDQQAAIEGTMEMMSAALSGGNLIHDMGFIDLLLSSSYEMLVSMDEVAGMVKRIAKGLWISKESFALDAIDEVGPSGEFLSTQHTRDHFRELWRPMLMNRLPYDVWKSEGALTMGEKARNRTREILEGYKPEPLDKGVDAALKRMLEQAEEHVAGTHK